MTGLMLRTTIEAVIGLAMIWFLARSPAAKRFRELRWPIVFSAALFWGGLTTLLVVFYWDNYFASFKPDWVGWWNPFLAALVYGLVGLLRISRLAIPANEGRSNERHSSSTSKSVLANGS